MPSAEAVRKLESDAEVGLASDEVRERQKTHGPNAMPETKGETALVRFLRQFHQPLIYILIVASVASLWLGEMLDAALIFGVVLINAIVGYVQEAKAVSAIGALSRSLKVRATVRRDGERVEIDAREIVPGDIIMLEAGDRVPADLRLLRVRDLRVDESALTGESEPSAKSAEALDPPGDDPGDAPDAEPPLGDRIGMAYASTLVSAGNAEGIAVAIGEGTEIGRISELVSSAERLETPLTRRLARLSHWLVIIIIAVAALMYVVGTMRGGEPREVFMAAVGLAVAAIPEGLPAAVTITLAIGVARMARRNAIIRSLPAVETLGSTTVICSDKTGTLTRNEMTVTRIACGDSMYAIEGRGYEPTGDIARIGDDDESEPANMTDGPLHVCLLAGTLCNDSTLRRDERGDWEAYGDPTEVAMTVAAEKAGIGRGDARSRHPRLDEVPFSSERQFMATLHEAEGDRARLIVVKGGVERVLAMCGHRLRDDGSTAPIDRDEVLATQSALAHGGLRVLALAQRETDDGRSELDEDDLDDLVFVGLQGMFDPPREAATEAVTRCRDAGISVKMITGDHATTAAAIAQQMGIGTHAARRDGDGSDGSAPPTLAGDELARIDDAGLPARATDTCVFARVSPEQKLRLVRALQSTGAVVAMTGDGVNDAPALRQADIGIAMGRGGTEAAREASDMVLTDDDFATIAAAVEEGRGTYDNIVKFVVWTLPTNGGQGLVILAATLLGMTLPVTPPQILWVNMTTALLLGLTLAFERKEDDIMERPPRPPQAALVGRRHLLRGTIVSVLMAAAGLALFTMLVGDGAEVEIARTAVCATIVFVQIGFLFNCRSLTRAHWTLGLFSNPILLGGVATMIAVQLAFTHVPAMNALFSTAPLGVREWLLVLLFALAVHTVIGVEKMIARTP